MSGNRCASSGEGHRSRPRAFRRVPLAVWPFGLGALAVAFTLAVAWSARVTFDDAALAYGDVASIEICARDGTPLRVVPGGGETRAAWTPLAAISPSMIAATLAAEDRRFHHHAGIDALAVARAGWRNLRAGRIVSGGSTLTQQLAGMLWPEPRMLSGKLREAVRALRLERRLSKEEILEQYLNRAPYGNGIQGVGEAARCYFQRSPAALTASQAALLAALPQAPRRLEGTCADARLLARRTAILGEMARSGALTPAEAGRAGAAPLTLAFEKSAFRAPHFADWVLGSSREATGRREGAPENEERVPRVARLVTTLDPGIQEEVERAVAAAVARDAAGDSAQAAVVVLAVASGEVLAMLGSTEWSDPHAGQVNGALALRQPGSALKPFLYALAFDRGLSAADLLADVPLHLIDEKGADVSPRNYDGRFHGPLRAREALAGSFNVPAVRLTASLGVDEALAGLRAAGLASLAADAARYGAGLALGVGEVPLLDLTAAYAGLARGGAYVEPVRLRAAFDAQGRELSDAADPREEEGQTPRRWCTPAAAFLTASILADDEARIAGFGTASAIDLPFPVAVKTGTSTGARDAWCVGFDRDHAVGVWLGRFDGRPLAGRSALQCAGPLFREIMLRLHDRGSRPWEAGPPPGWRPLPVCALSGGVPGRACAGTVLEWFAPDDYARRAECSFHQTIEDRAVTVWPEMYADWAREEGLLAKAEVGAPAGGPRIASPQDGSVYFLDATLGPSAAIRFAALTDGERASWELDGHALGPAADLLWPPVPGEHLLVLRGASGSARVRFSVR